MKRAVASWYGRAFSINNNSNNGNNSAKRTAQSDLHTVGVIFSPNEQKTRKLGGHIAQRCQRGDVVCLIGDMGSGKTILAQGFVRTIIGDEGAHVTSPTFLLDLTYESSLPQSHGVTVHHMDLYRLEEQIASHNTLYRLNIPAIFSSDISLIEWGDKLGEEHRPNRNYLEIRVQYGTQSDKDISDTSDEKSDDPYGESRTIEIFATEPNRWKDLL